MVHQLEKGAGLEQRIESFFRLHGYETNRNVIREGRSGAPHEIDVLATKADGVTDFTILVECKAWDTPIAKDVVSKLSMEMADLGVHKGIVVSLKGWTSGAELTAKELGVELWGTVEIRDRLGQVAVAEIAAGPSARTGRGFVIAVQEPQAAPRLMATARGFLGFGREDLVWIKLIWVPFFVIELDHSKSRSTFLKGTVTETTTRWNLYEGLSGTFFMTFESAPNVDEVALGHALAPRAQTRRLQREINEAIKKVRSVVTETAQHRYAEKLIALGVPADTEATMITRSEVVHIPVYAALLRSADSHRLIGIDAVWNTRWTVIETALTANASYVIEAFGEASGPEAAAFASARNAARPTLRQVAVVAAIGLAEYILMGREFAPFVAAFTATVAVVVFFAFLRWKREQR